MLWCPFDHGEQNMPRTELLWQSATEVTDILTPTPEPDAVQYGDYLPEPCHVDPEQIVEYPAAAELDEELRRRVTEWSTRQTAGAGPGGLYDGAQELFYHHELSLAPGWKAGGWAPWSVTDPHPQYCTVCRSRMEPMLTVASYEWQPDGPSWIPYEDRAAAALPTVYPTLANPTRINLMRRLQPADLRLPRVAGTSARHAAPVSSQFNVKCPGIIADLRHSDSNEQVVRRPVQRGCECFAGHSNRLMSLQKAPGLMGCLRRGRRLRWCAGPAGRQLPTLCGSTAAGATGTRSRNSGSLGDLTDDEFEDHGVIDTCHAARCGPSSGGSTRARAHANG